MAAVRAPDELAASSSFVELQGPPDEWFRNRVVVLPGRTSALSVFPGRD